ncbi:hypothetical protein F511_47110 [Dorcoceras hygrometricum]|uniref:Uncharacterized protein n=1 Tax=Dorcoceras hygrometricum TaxID=472368 RepID=A0A2Z6ZRU1_9LAMI|nr:hypothetical protein F511_47110 [Dorcoceras hygrometricum]
MALLVHASRRWPLRTMRLVARHTRDVAAERALCAARNFRDGASAGRPPLRRCSGEFPAMS